MAGTIIADYIRTDANQLSLNVGNTTFATINASGFFSNTGTQLIAANGKISGASLVSGSITSAAFATAANTIPRSSMTAGAVLQVVQGVKTDTFVSSATVTDTAVTGLTVSITPTSASSKILVFVNLGIGAENSQGGATKLTRTISATVTQLSLADAAGSRSRGSFAGSAYRGNASNYTAIFGHQGLTYLDSPTTTSAITYGVQVSSLNNGTYINRNEADGNSNDTYRGVSYITVMEIAA